MISRSQGVVKRTFDIAGSSIAIVLFAPLVILLALLVKLTSKGPAFYKQTRIGLDGRLFEIIKLRTMTVGAPYVQFSDGSSMTARNDPRVTRIGRILRATSLDELPQFYNVLRGDMSIVGPRPDQLEQAAFYDEENARKLAMRPGITGLAMIRGRNSIPWKVRIKYDIEYIDRYTLLLDAKIFLRTVPLVLLRQGVCSPPPTETVAAGYLSIPSVAHGEQLELHSGAEA